MKKSDLEHQLWKKIKEHDLQNKRIMVGLSAGIDSVALLALLQQVHPRKTAAFYFHHGDNENQIFRDQARMFCEKLCKKLDVPFFTLTSQGFAKSEAELREFRFIAFQQILKQEKYDYTHMGHWSGTGVVVFK